MKKLAIIVFALLMSSCTTVIMNHTQGSASDVVDSTPTTTTDVSPDITIPASIVPKI